MQRRTSRSRMRTRSHRPSLRMRAHSFPQGAEPTCALTMKEWTSPTLVLPLDRCDHESQSLLHRYRPRAVSFNVSFNLTRYRMRKLLIIANSEEKIE